MIDAGHRRLPIATISGVSAISTWAIKTNDRDRQTVSAFGAGAGGGTGGDDLPRGKPPGLDWVLSRFGHPRRGDVVTIASAFLDRVGRGEALSVSIDE